MTNGAGGILVVIRVRPGRAKAVSPLRSRLRFASARQVATALQDASRGLVRSSDATLAGVSHCCGSQTRGPFASGAFPVAAVI